MDTENMSPTSSFYINSWPTTVSGKIIRTTWCDVDFSSGNEKNHSSFHTHFFTSGEEQILKILITALQTTNIVQ
jgi:hypothetical protein